MEHSCKHSRTEASNSSFFASDVPVIASNFVWNSNQTLYMSKEPLAEPDQPHHGQRLCDISFLLFSVVFFLSLSKPSGVRSPFKNVSRTPPLVHLCRMWTKSRGKAVTRKDCDFDKEQRSTVQHTKVHPSDDLTALCLSRCDHAGSGHGGGRGPRLPQLGRHERWALPQEIPFISCTLIPSFGVDAVQQLDSALVCVSVSESVSILITE